MLDYWNRCQRTPLFGELYYQPATSNLEKGPDLDYDPVSFDLKSRNKNGDYRIVKIDHEEILCNNRIRVVAELAPSFEHLVRQTIDQANRI